MLILDCAAVAMMSACSGKVAVCRRYGRVILLTETPKRYLRTTLVVIAVLSAFASWVSAAYGEVLSIENELTPDHVLVSDAEAYFIPASGMTLSGKFAGFVSPERGAELLVARIAKPYVTIYETFTDSALKMRGVDVKSRGSLRLNDADAVLIKALHEVEGNKWGKWILLLDCGGSTLVVNGVFISGDSQAAEGIETMIKSVIARKSTITSNDIREIER